MSIRYKFILILQILTAVCLGIYIWIAKSVFEDDKKRAIFESASQISAAHAFTLKQNLAENIRFATTLVPSFDPATGKLSAAGRDLFLKKQDLFFVGIYEPTGFVVFEEKLPAVDLGSLTEKLRAGSGEVIQEGDRFRIYLIIPLRSDGTGGSELRRLVVGVDLTEQLQLLDFSPEQGGSFLALGDQALSTRSEFPFSMARGFLQVLPYQKNLTEQTLIEYVQGTEYLISILQVQTGELRLVTMIPKKTAFLGLSKLYVKSLQFFGLIFFVVLIVAILMTNTLLRNLDRLTSATSKISQGNFDFSVGVESRDEFGALAKSFQRMSQEIKRLIFATREKARMETELRTAQAVQEHLFPAREFKNSMLEMNGLYRPASECGGDWWYYFEHPTGVYVLICDATGHGAPAALITAAAKASINLMKREKDLDLAKLAQAFNYALHETAKGHLLMTGFILHFKNDSSIEYVNASHEPPFIFQETGLDFMMDPIGPRFGQDPGSQYETGHLQLKSKDVLILYTDGITGQKNKLEKDLGDRRFTRFLRNNGTTGSLQMLNESVFQMVDEFRQDQSQDDDLTIVSIRIQ